MDDSIADIEKSIEQLRNSLEDTFKFKTKLELNKSDLLHFIKMAEQNMKYLKKRNTIVIVSEYQKVIKSHASAVRQIEDLDQQIYAIEQAIDKLTKNLAEQVKLLETLKKATEPKIISFNRRS